MCFLEKIVGQMRGSLAEGSLRHMLYAEMIGVNVCDGVIGVNVCCGVLEVNEHRSGILLFLQGFLPL